MIIRSRLAALTVSGLGCALLPSVASAQAYDQFLSPTVPGYDTTRGVELLQRPRTEYDPLGVRVGEFIVRPELDEGVTYDSNVLGTRPSVGSWAVNSTPTVQINSDFGTNSVGAVFGINDLRYLDQKQESHTDWNASLGGSYQIGQDVLTLAASEIYNHENPTDINSTNVGTPLGFKVTDLRLRYVTRLNYWQVEPNLEYIGYRFDPVVEAGAQLTQKVRDRDDVIGGVTIRFGKIPERSVVLVLRAAESRFIASQGGAPRPDSLIYEALVGADYAFSANLQALLLVGYELDTFNNSSFSNLSAPVVQGSVVWAPSGLTTLTATVSRSIQDSIGQNTTGVKVLQGEVIVDHEYLRNVLLQGRSSVISTNYAANQQQTIYNLGASFTYLLNRNVRLTATYDFFDSTGNTTNQAPLEAPGAIGNAFSASSVYNRHVALVGLKFTL